MNAKTTASGATAAVLPGALIIAAALAVSALTGLQAQRDHYRAEAARPQPTVTETTAAPVTGRTTVPAPAAASPAATTVLAGGEPSRTDGSPAGRAGVSSSGRGPTVRPSPTAQAPATPAPVVAVSLRHPLGVLPGADLTVGGGR
ncbi:MAG: hypothetical protein ACRDP6_00515 [Actinoallomurus sp.]